MDKMFELATRCKYRFPFRGSISVEDLWDLDVKYLDSVFKILNAEAKEANEESLLITKTKEDDILNTKIEIVKYIVSIKLAEENARLQAKEKKEKKQRIMEIVASKQDADLQNKSITELQAMIDELE